MLKQVVIFCAFLAIASAFVQLAPLEPIPKKYKGQQGCYLQEFDKIAPFGSTTPSKQQCVEYRCRNHDVEIAGCSIVRMEPPCYTVEDKTKPYPGCCPQPACPQNKHLL